MKSLFEEIEIEYKKLVDAFAQVSNKKVKCLEGTGRKVSASNLIAYQIGWGKLLISWYEAGLKGKMPEMPGDGFTTWDYSGLAKHFYQKYFKNLDEEFENVVNRILEIVKTEEKNLDKVGIWPWCTLPSGKEWPLSKWVRVNTVSPYKRASGLIRKFNKR